MSQSSNRQRLHDVDIEGVAKRLVEMACTATGSNNGALFLYDPKRNGLSVDFHMVSGVVVTLPGTGALLKLRKDGRSNGIALTCFDQGKPYLCNDTSVDPNYARYFLDVAAVLAVPIPWQGKPLGVLTVSSTTKEAFTYTHVEALELLASDAASFLRRAQLARSTKETTGRPYVIKGLSPAWLEVERRIEHVSNTDAPVLVTGESGTGKDLVSRAIHFNSQRANKPFVTVNCAAIPETMLESVLFGHVKGAFTGASFDKVGEFQKADGGTLFLDELGELPLMLQAKVLRAIEQGEVSPLGSNKAPGRVDVRLICATNRDLATWAREGRFRDDLYFRVSVITVELPALRTYKDNLEILAHVFLQQAATKHRRSIKRLSPEALSVLQAYEFPGNVRELKNAMEHAAIMATGDEVGVDALPKAMREAKGAVAAVTKAPSAQFAPLEQMRQRWLATQERAYLSEVLTHAQGNVDAAAKLLEVNRVTLYRLMKRHGIALSRRPQLG